MSTRLRDERDVATWNAKRPITDPLFSRKSVDVVSLADVCAVLYKVSATVNLSGA